MTEIIKKIKRLVCRLTVFVFFILLSLFALFGSTCVYADVSGDLGTFFTNLGYQGNVSNSHAYQGQEAGYYSGGSLFLRNQSRNIQILHVDLPSFRAGCGGIDLFAGGFSFVNSDQLTQFFQQIMTSATGYTFQLALETAEPELAHTLQYIQNLAANMNNSNLNSCEMAEDLVGGTWPQTRASQQQVCQDVGMQHNIFSDWAAARQGCGSGNDFNSTMKTAASDPSYQNRVVVNKNLIWDAIQQNGFLQSDRELSELFMSLSGTIVYDQNSNVTPYPSLAGNRDLLKALLYGGQAQIYQCQDLSPSSNLCLSISVGTINIDPNHGLISQVNNMIFSLSDAVKQDQSITPAQEGFLNSTEIPILKFITVISTLNIDPNAVDLSQYAEVIAEDLLSQYLSESLGVIKQSLTTKNYTPDIQHELTEQIEGALGQVQQYQTDAYRKVQDTFVMIKNMQFLEDQVVGNLTSSLKENLKFESNVG